MTFREFMVRMLVFIQPLAPIVLVALAVTIITILVLSAVSKGKSAENTLFNWLGLFFDLSVIDCVRLACSWLKFLLILVYLVAFRSLTAASLFLILVPSILGAIRFHSARDTVSNILWLIVEFAAFISTNLVCSFIHTYNSGIGMIAVYICMAVFTALLAVFLFLTELGKISEGRQPYVIEE